MSRMLIKCTCRPVYLMSDLSTALQINSLRSINHVHHIRGLLQLGSLNKRLVVARSSIYQLHASTPVIQAFKWCLNGSAEQSFQQFNSAFDTVTLEYLFL